jgi:hypothetical protein
MSYGCFDNEFSNLPLSNMNESGEYIFSCDDIRKTVNLMDALVNLHQTI